MSKKLRKVLFLAAAVSTAAAAFCYLRKKHSTPEDSEEEDYDDFSDAEETDSDASGSYVTLTPETAEQAAETTEDAPQDTFTPLAEQVVSPSDKVNPSVEEFFDEEDSSEEDPPASGT